MRKKRAIIGSIALVSFVSASLTVAGERNHNSKRKHSDSKVIEWGYTGDIGPEYWGELDRSFATCSSGMNQSPIDLNNMLEADLPYLNVNYTVGGDKVINNGHAIEIEYVPGSTISLDGQSFELKQFHFHSPSENTINGESFPMEAHYVHANEDGKLAVISLMFQEGEMNVELEKAWAYMPENAGESHELPDPLNGIMLLPQDR
ncbi:MAG: carbonic anhydrase family protein, partial [Candidatus Thiodiazotropha sp.]